MALTRLVSILTWMFAISVLTPAAIAQGSKPSQGIMNKLLAPGPLMEGHKDLEHARCLSCHAAAKGVPDTKCLDCHKDIKKSMERPTSFHKLTKKPCISCHRDHLGRDHDSVAVDRDKFDHSTTGHPLSKSHANLECQECHKQKRESKAIRSADIRYFGPTETCLGCHKKDDPHQFQDKLAAADCNQCHSDLTWKVPGVFDSIKPNSLPPPPHFYHNAETRYRIDGKHLTVPCSECHIKLISEDGSATAFRKYQWPDLNTKTCESCHKNPHTGKFPPALASKKCDQCHVTSSWTKLPALEKKFDHNNLTRFELTGRHREINCAACHEKNGQDIYKFKGESSGYCVSCHENVHNGQFRPDYAAEACLTCHDTVNFSKLKPFDHNKQTHFKLTGDHFRIKDQCSRCHTPTNRPLGKESKKLAGKFIFEHGHKDYCVDCHSNVHVGQFTDHFADQSCSSCHSTDTFLTRLPFNHESTRYKIIGKHLGLKCAQCHTLTSTKFPPPSPRQKGKYLFPELASQSCAACHNDPHKGKLGSRCMNCHSEAHNWSSIDDFHKNYLLTGVHNLLACEQCHGPNNHRRLTGASERCVFCHKKDDNHNGGLSDCAQCHSQQTWKTTTFNHSMSQFPLLGAHRTTDCNSCHKRGVYEGTPTDCRSCHAKDALTVTFPNHSLAGFEDCGSCHNPFSFKGAKR